MSRKDYNRIAAEFAKQVDANRFNVDALRAIRELAEGIASVMAADNPAFRRSTFLDACGVSDLHLGV